MIIYIQQDLTAHTETDPLDARKLLKRYRVASTFTESGNVFRVFARKVCLNEHYMTHVLHTLSECFDFRVEYHPHPEGVYLDIFPKEKT